MLDDLDPYNYNYNGSNALFCGLAPGKSFLRGEERYTYMCGSIRTRGYALPLTLACIRLLHHM